MVIAMDWSQKTTPLRQLTSAPEREIANLELSFLDPQVRQSDRPEQLLAEDFREVGTAGRISTKAELLESMKAEPLMPRSVDDLQVRMLALNVALVTYRAHYSRQPAAESLHSSVWVHRQGYWQMVFHQATPCQGAK